MKRKSWQRMIAFAVCVAALLIGGRTPVAAAQDVPDEAALIQVIKSDAGWAEKQTACRALRVKGTAASVPALAALLPDKELAHMARYALEAMPYPEAGQALRDALAKTQGMLKCGMIISLGARRDAEAVPLLIPLLKDPDVDIARAAIGALGRIAAPEAVQALLDFRSAAPEAVRGALAEGLLAAGQRLVKDGKGESAAPICQELLASSWPLYVRMGAFRGLADAQPDKAPQRLIEALGGNEPLFRDMAAEIIAETSGADTTRLYAEAFPKLSSGGQAALLRGLAGRKDAVARPVVEKAILNSDRGVKLAAVKALGALGSAENVPALAGLLASDDAEAAAAATTGLTSMAGPDVNPAIATAFSKAQPAARAKLLELLANRRAEQTLPLAAGALNDADMPVRIAALKALGPLGAKEQVPGILAVLAKTADASERTAVENALGAICSRAGEETLPLLVDTMKAADLDARIVLLHVLARIGGPKALEPVLAALTDANAQIGDEAVRVLSDWPTADAVPHVLKLAQGDDLSRQVLGLRGYVRLAGIEPSVEEKTHMLTAAMALAKRPDEKKLVLGAWGAVPTLQSLDALRPHLDDAAVQNEAAIALITIAPELAKIPDAKPKVVDALKAVIDKCTDSGIKDRAQKALAPLQ